MPTLQIIRDVVSSVSVEYILDADPSVFGVDADLGKLLVRTDVPSLYYKSGITIFSWTLLTVPGPPGPGGNSTGSYGCPAITAVRDTVYLSAADTVSPADASSVAMMPVLGLVLSKPTAITCVVQYNGELGGFAGLVSGSRYFASLIAGAIVLPGDPNFPVSPGEVVQVIAVARNATTVVISPAIDYAVL